MVFDPSKAGKSLCACGMVADTFGGLCDRCVSLQTLGLTSDATSDLIENTYRTLVKVWHPDRFSHDPKLSKDAEEKLKEINSAHDYLLTHPKQRPERPAEKPPTPERPFVPSDFDFEGEETEEIKRILRRREKSRLPGILLRIGIALGAVAFVAILWFAGDSFLSSNQLTARSWNELKLELQHDFSVHFGSTSTSAAQPAPVAAPATSTTVAAAETTPASQKEKISPAQQAQKHLVAAKPYITAGLTPAEVISVLGNPTSSTGEKMFYSGSEIDFKNGQVAGWKIDPAAPIRVKLWSETPSVPGLNTFGLGSTKSDVIALQGTPTIFSDNDFGYGNSHVFFQNNRVTSWKDSASAPLRVAR
ncbi:J domain-containing protein [Occallatibacter savannae]|uniref:J domain-containing protein n=1 Tax=Occallatibacter savannae TaxID=1002691 RepID=UPI000D687B38|nr:J domain-containing protein [Occallatibacter savannae]